MDDGSDTALLFCASTGSLESVIPQAVSAMGQSTVDLPDPTDATLDDAASADDLLAQLAGDEIDRLLAEADAGTSPSPPPPRASSAPPANAAVAPAPPPAPAFPAAQAPDTTELPEPSSDSVGLETAPAHPDPIPLPAREQPPTMETSDLPLPADPVNTPPLEASATVAPADEPPSAAEALRAELEAETSPRPIVEPGPSLPDVLDEVLTSSAQAAPPSVPLLLKPLEWMNRPFAFIPAETRMRLGKVGLITLINALVILAYVLFFRGD